MKKTNQVPVIKADPLLNEARELLIAANRPCESLIQRKLRISYSRAMQLLRALEGDVVTAPDTYGHRQMIQQG